MPSFNRFFIISFCLERGTSMYYEKNKDNILKTFGRNICQARNLQNLSQRQLSNKSNYDRICLSRCELGKIDIRYQSALRIVKALGISFPDSFRNSFSINSHYIEDDYLLVFRENFKSACLQRNISNYQIAQNTGIPESMISKILSGKQKNPQIRTLSAMAFGVNKTLSELVSRHQ